MTMRQIHPAGKWILKIESEAWEEIQWVQDKSWSFLFAESPVMTILREEDGDDDGGSDGKRLRPPRRSGTTTPRSGSGSGSGDSSRTPPLHGRSRPTKTRSRVFTSSGSKMRRTDSPLEEDEEKEDIEVRALTKDQTGNLPRQKNKNKTNHPLIHSLTPPSLNPLPPRRTLWHPSSLHPPLQDGASFSDLETERLLTRLLQSLRDDDGANPDDVRAVQAAVTVVASRSRRTTSMNTDAQLTQFNRGTIEAETEEEAGAKAEAYVLEGNEHEHEHAKKMSCP